MKAKNIGNGGNIWTRTLMHVIFVPFAPSVMEGYRNVSKNTSIIRSSLVFLYVVH